MSFESSVRRDAPAGCSTPLLAIAVPQAGLPASLASLDTSLGGGLGRVFSARDFIGKADEAVVLYPDGPAARIMLVGVGKEPSRSAIRRAASVAAKRARIIGVPSATFFLTPEARAGVSPADAGQAIAEGLGQGAWFFAEMKRPADEPKPPLERFDVVDPDADTAFEAGHRIGVAIAAGQALTRGVQVLPSNVCTPSYLGRIAGEIGERHGMAVTVLDRAAIEKEGMGALLAVSQGGPEEPRFIALEYDGAPGAPVVLIGKGVTFDTGGISIKPALNMEDMKYDMSGAAAVLGTFEALGRLRPKIRVVGLIPSTENMPSGTAVKPGDVVKSHLGKTIEVINTDAEGRLILADALSYARRYAPACVIDMATLTGAMVVALGHTATGVMGTDEPLIDEIRAAGDRSGERVWPLPLWDEYRDLIKSDIADMKNSGGRPAGSISAGWFLREFVDGFPWAHLDIAGTAYTEREEPIRVKGPTGVGVRLCMEFVLARQH